LGHFATLTMETISAEARLVIVGLRRPRCATADSRC
jgi:hypothetical protein